MGRLIPAGTGMEYYRNVDIERDETIGESEREEEFPEVLGGIEIPPSPHTVTPTTGDADRGCPWRPSRPLRPARSALPIPNPMVRVSR